jgi:hypothetical protein
MKVETLTKNKMNGLTTSPNLHTTILPHLDLYMFIFNYKCL